MKKPEFIRRLRKAKKEALRLYPNFDLWQVMYGQRLLWWLPKMGDLHYSLTGWYVDVGGEKCGTDQAFTTDQPSRAEVAALFDRSIAALEGK